MTKLITKMSYYNGTMSGFRGIGAGIHVNMEDPTAGLASALAALCPVSIGEGSIVGDNDAVALGPYANAAGIKSIAIGGDCISDGAGGGTNALGARSIAIGEGAGTGVNAAGADSIAIGTGSYAYILSGVAVGHLAASNTSAASLGYHAWSGTRSTAVGYNALALVTDGTDMVAVGYNSSAIGGNAVAVGSGASALVASSLALGKNATTATVASGGAGMAITVPADTVAGGNLYIMINGTRYTITVTAAP